MYICAAMATNRVYEFLESLSSGRMTQDEFSVLGMIGHYCDEMTQEAAEMCSCEGQPAWMWSPELFLAELVRRMRNGASPLRG